MKKPVIGITSTIVVRNEYSEGAYVHQDYHRSVEQAGGLPVVLPLTSPETFRELIDLCDGISFSGGEDVDPSCYGAEPHPALGSLFPERDRIEIEAVRHALNSDKPLLAICRGIQVLNVALGGSLYQDLPSEYPGAAPHMQHGVARGKDTHAVYIAEHSRLWGIFRHNQIRVNSLHHQALRQVAPGLVITATSPDGVIEAVELPGHAFAVGVQWHPESMTGTDPLMRLLFKELVSKSLTGLRERNVS
ncbi:gamma-glutamyl-gamma-aminobutyrate hydrolase family protein [Paenibacillus mucilaginosus]|uniref:Glutamine amidotransferase n=1 Tax=Paenibacillus mucilaginosus (strain KNP414) TaxID=1036673 RepID=F8FL98_PAEMK|nr:gamma-glutamyl-gamma-aminobutyrate hydrolase family protein [Paenibacillus mucilaginosus]AEI43466.1 glutamine amidotransferase [Paenibacillus mucilaginosus KNP414]MCG7211988.1 gamma-glutamyl-gamma-aminobutyrate hydrolase family protein [Paenibacillus mucilaginosus]WDM25023.1 gamma-glutamyl-gamma-aminobutyrate hydrolase family protein [Paenibacillus mucilaginosus]